MLKYFTAILVSLFFFTNDLSGQSANDLLAKMDQIMFGAKDRQGTVRIILINRAGKEKVREAHMMQKGTDLKLYRYTKPESQAEIATLSMPDGVMWLYMPAFGKPKKISLLAKSQAFTGTDFSYEDMSVSSYASSYEPTLIETSETEYILELIPKSEESSYSKIIVTVNKEYYYPTKMEYYDRIKKKFKEATYSYKKSGKYWYAGEVIMADLQKQHMTRIILTDMLFDQGIPDEEFTIEKLAPGQ